MTHIFAISVITDTVKYHPLYKTLRWHRGYASSVITDIDIEQRTMSLRSQAETFVASFLQRRERRADGKRNANSWRMDSSMSKLQAAIRWVNERQRVDRELSMPLVLADAARRFDLGLEDQSQLRHLFHT